MNGKQVPVTDDAREYRAVLAWQRSPGGARACMRAALATRDTLVRKPYLYQWLTQLQRLYSR